MEAQLEACAAYIQRQPGWVPAPKRYDDGGFTGANLERPAFQRLLADLEEGKVDVVEWIRSLSVFLGCQLRLVEGSA